MSDDAKSNKRTELLARIALTLSILVPYHRLATMRGVIITDDRIVSDVMNAEFPARVAVGQLVRSGYPPTWLNGACGGFPLLAGGGGASDPLTITLFSILPPVWALNLFILFALLVATHATYGYARRIGASVAGSALAGIGYAYSGFMVAQMKHLGVIAIVCWLPLGLRLLEDALAAREEEPGPGKRLIALSLFTLVFALQWLAGFPQSAYICALVYGAYAIARVVSLRGKREQGSRWFRRPVLYLLAFGVACGIAIGMAMVLLVPMNELSNLSERAGGVNVDWASRIAYWPRNFFTFFVPYLNGDISDLSYRGVGLFWEDYGYVGFATMLLAIVAATARNELRRAHVLFFVITTVVAYLIVLGPHTPVFRILFKVLPGMKSFRFPTRFLFVVDFGICILAAFGLTRLEALLSVRTDGWARNATKLSVAVTVLTFGDLVFHQMRQNPIVPAATWLARPSTVRFMDEAAKAKLGPRFRILTPSHRMSHSITFNLARGWSDVRPYFAYRDLVQPNTNLLYGYDSADCYAGLMPRHTLALWSETGLLSKTAAPKADELLTHPVFFKLLAMNNVRYVLSPWSIASQDVELVYGSGIARVYEMRAWRPRAFLVHRASFAKTGKDAVDRISDPAFDPAHEVVLNEGEPLPKALPPLPSIGDRADIVTYLPNEVVIETESTQPGWLVLSDTYYPGWSAELDGKEAPHRRANFVARALEIPAGRHVVRYRFQSASAKLGARLTIASASLFGLLTLFVLAWNRRAMMRRSS